VIHSATTLASLIDVIASDVQHVLAMVLSHPEELPLPLRSELIWSYPAIPHVPYPTGSPIHEDTRPPLTGSVVHIIESTREKGIIRIKPHSEEPSSRHFISDRELPSQAFPILHGIMLLNHMDVIRGRLTHLLNALWC
jgi:hypothetical protein